MPTIALDFPSPTPSAVAMLSITGSDGSTVAVTGGGAWTGPATESDGQRFTYAFTGAAATYTYTAVATFGGVVGQPFSGTWPGDSSGPATLVPTARWTANPVLAAANAANPTYAAALVAAASDAVERYCHRRFAMASHREYLSGPSWPGNELILPDTPVASLDRICTRAVPVLSVTNTTAQLARVGTTIAPDGSTAAVLLTSTTAGVTTTATVTGLTLTDLATAVNATAGWAATVVPAYELWPTAEMRPLQGAVPAIGRAARLDAWVEGSAYADGFGCWDVCGERWRLDAEAGIIYGRFPRGESNVRIDYTAGYATVPAPVQEAVVRLAQIAWLSASRDPNLTSEKLGPYGATYATTVPGAITDAQVRGWLAPFVSHSNLIVLR